jgi:glucan phosphoethanolaminetransferase (alkaline phosphatase superfamily)
MAQLQRLSGLMPLWPVALFFGIDLSVSFFLRAPLHSRHGYTTLVSIFSTLLFWITWVALTQFFESRVWRAFWSVLTGVGFALIVPVNSYLYSIFGEYLGSHHLELMGDRIEILWEYVQSYSLSKPLLIVPILGIAFVSSWTWYRSVGFRPFQRRTQYLTLILGPLLFLVMLNQLDKHAGGHHIPMDSRTWVTLRGLLTKTAVPLLHRSSYRVQPASVLSKPDFDVLIVLNESLGAQKIKAFGFDESTMPFFEQWMEKEPLSFFTFKESYSNATASDVSLPSLLTGVAPYESNAKLHKNPLVWNWGRAAGMKTFFLIPITRYWCRFDQFFFGSELDIGISREQLGAPIYKDLAADEMILANRFEQLLTETPINERLMGVYYAHSMHAPFQVDSPLIDFVPEKKTRYEKALFVLDRAYEKIFGALKKSGRLEKTVVIFTSDHGEPDAPIHSIQRLFSYYRETLRIPMMIYIPQSLREQHPEWVAGLRANESKTVSNLEVVPTVMDLLGAGSEISTYGMEGRSLLQPLPEQRPIVSLSSNSVKQLSVKGFGIYWSDRSVVYSTREGMGLYDHKNDPDQKENLWSRTPAEQRAQILEIIESNPELSQIYRP